MCVRECVANCLTLGKLHVTVHLTLCTEIHQVKCNNKLLLNLNYIFLIKFLHKLVIKIMSGGILFKLLNNFDSAIKIYKKLNIFCTVNETTY